MNEDYFFDTYAIIELIKGNPNYDFVEDKVIITGAMNMAETYYALLLENKEDVVNSIIKKLNIEIVDISQEIAIESAKLRYKNKKSFLSYIDCIGYILAKENNLIFLTGDKEFEEMENVEFVKK